MFLANFFQNYIWLSLLAIIDIYRMADDYLAASQLVT